jgi:hypothetical protein
MATKEDAQPLWPRHQLKILLAEKHSHHTGTADRIMLSWVQRSG